MDTENNRQSPRRIEEVNKHQSATRQGVGGIREDGNDSIIDRIEAVVKVERTKIEDGGIV